MKNAKIIAFHGHNESMQLLEVPIPTIEAGEILVKNLYTTICGSDLHTYCGLRKENTPTVLGHEIVGEILAISAQHSGMDYCGNTLQVGDRITWSIFSSDVNSEMARKGMPQKGSGLFKYGHAQITNTDTLHGGLGTHCILKAGTAVLKIATDIPLPIAATINCAVATVAGAFRLAGTVKNSKVLITGAGLLGIVSVAMSKAAGAATIHVADINEQRLLQAKEFGADEIHMLSSGTPENLKDIDVAFDMSGSPEAMELGLASLAIGGLAVWVGAVLNTRKIQVDAEKVIRRLLTIKGLHNYNFEDFVCAVDFISEHYQNFPFSTIVGREFALKDAEAAFDYALKKKPLRVGILINPHAGD
ncbi:zinc-binding dehydrogenase [Olivibacter domesticus]|uniref:alcohol dehydrogenase n=1 Tax=Olivibacter domesticus TaxID=407022 RepID=A0A1H7K7B6_OLID1|nr:zinc-binding dehydrogenase [Olivibacter domesticus]SEK82758.1 alcohol dehydrogenase [Olivibacter domesticus]